MQPGWMKAVASRGSIDVAGPVTPSPSTDLSKPPDELVFRPSRSPNLFEETVGRLGQGDQDRCRPVGERSQTSVTSASCSASVVRRFAKRCALQQAGLIEVRRGRRGERS
jgi:hypothetical protein